jgi:hypothetical protein
LLEEIERADHNNNASRFAFVFVKSHEAVRSRIL